MKLDYIKLQSQFKAGLSSHEELAEIIQLRQHAIQSLPNLQLPKLTKFNYQDWSLGKVHHSSLKKFPAIQKSTTDNQISLKMNEELVTITLPAELKERGVILTDLFSAMKEAPEIMSRYLMHVFHSDEDLLTAYHTAFLNRGILLYIPQDVQITSPVHLEINFDGQTPETTNFHLLIVSAQNSQCQIIEHLSSSANQTSPLTNFMEIIAEDNSKVRFSSLDQLNQTVPAYYQYRASIGRQAKVEWAIGMMNECNTVGEIDSELIGEGANANSQLIALTSGKQQLGLNNRVTNRSPHSQGLINQRGVALGDSRLIFNGIGQIIHGAHGSQAEQQNRLLMMSPYASGDANPILLIDENDVEAGHAASVGKINQDQLYYLLSRGIPKHQAQRMVIRGFLSAVITAMPDKNVRQRMVDILERKLKGNE